MTNPDYDAAHDAAETEAPPRPAGQFDGIEEDDFGAEVTPQFQPAPAGQFDDEDVFEDAPDDLLANALAAGPSAEPERRPSRPGVGSSDFVDELRSALNPTRGETKTRDQKVHEAEVAGALEYMCQPQGRDGKPMPKEQEILWGHYRESELHAELTKRKPQLRCSWLVMISTMNYASGGELRRKPIKTVVVRTDVPYMGDGSVVTQPDEDDDEYEEDDGMVDPYEQPDSDDDLALPAVATAGRSGNGQDNTAILVMREMFKDSQALVREVISRDQHPVEQSRDPLESLDRMADIFAKMNPGGGGNSGGSMEDAMRVVGEIHEKGQQSAKSAERPKMMDMMMMPLMMMAAPMMMNTPMFKNMLESSGMGGMMPGMGGGAPAPDPNAPPLPTPPQPNGLPAPPQQQPQPTAQQQPQQKPREELAREWRHSFVYTRLNQLIGSGNTQKFADDAWWADNLFFSATKMAIEDLLAMDAGALAKESLAVCPNVKQHVEGQLPEGAADNPEQAAQMSEAGMTEWWGSVQQGIRSLMNPQQQSPPDPPAETSQQEPPPPEKKALPDDL